MLVQHHLLVNRQPPAATLIVKLPFPSRLFGRLAFASVTALAVLPIPGRAAFVSGGFQAVADDQIVRSTLTSDEMSTVVHFHAMLNMPQKQALQALIDAGGQLSRN